METKVVFLAALCGLANSAIGQEYPTRFSWGDIHNRTGDTGNTGNSLDVSRPDSNRSERQDSLDRSP